MMLLTLCASVALLFCQVNSGKGECVDNHPDIDCSDYADDCTNPIYQADMHEHCPETCGLCDKRDEIAQPHPGWMNRKRSDQREEAPPHTAKKRSDCPYKDLERMAKQCKDQVKARHYENCEPGHRDYKFMMLFCKATCKCRTDISVKRSLHPRSTLSPAPGETASLITNGVIKYSLAAHNKYRHDHGESDLVWDDNLAKSSQDYALKLANEGKFEHSIGGGYGENLYWRGTYSPSVDAEEMCNLAVKAWYDEIKFYDYNRPKFGYDTGHFTQVVWKSTHKVGMGVAKVKTNTFTRVVVVAQYTPPGNYMGQFAKNVPPPV